MGSHGQVEDTQSYRGRIKYVPKIAAKRFNSFDLSFAEPHSEADVDRWLDEVIAKRPATDFLFRSSVTKRGADRPGDDSIRASSGELPALPGGITGRDTSSNFYTYEERLGVRPERRGSLRLKEFSLGNGFAENAARPDVDDMLEDKQTSRRTGALGLLSSVRDRLGVNSGRQHLRVQPAGTAREGAWHMLKRSQTSNSLESMLSADSGVESGAGLRMLDESHGPARPATVDEEGLILRRMSGEAFKVAGKELDSPAERKSSEHTVVPDPIAAGLTWQSKAWRSNTGSLPSDHQTDMGDEVARHIGRFRNQEVADAHAHRGAASGALQRPSVLPVTLHPQRLQSMRQRLQDGGRMLLSGLARVPRDTTESTQVRMQGLVPGTVSETRGASRAAGRPLPTIAWDMGPAPPTTSSDTGSIGLAASFSAARQPAGMRGGVGGTRARSQGVGGSFGFGRDSDPPPSEDLDRLLHDLLGGR